MTTRSFVWIAPIALLGATLLPLTAAQAQVTVNQRLHDQQARIHQGIASGQLTHREAHTLIRQDKSIQRQERIDRFRDGGHLTAGERTRLNGRLNRESGEIYRLKHNDRVR